MHSVSACLGKWFWIHRHGQKHQVDVNQQQVVHVWCKCQRSDACITFVQCTVYVKGIEVKHAVQLTAAISVSEVKQVVH